MGTALIAFLNAELRPGIDVVLEETQFKQRIKDANLVIYWRKVKWINKQSMAKHPLA